jgi:hypothetical protein
MRKRKSLKRKGEIAKKAFSNNKNVFDKLKMLKFIVSILP